MVLQKPWVLQNFCLNKFMVLLQSHVSFAVTVNVCLTVSIFSQICFEVSMFCKAKKVLRTNLFVFTNDAECLGHGDKSHCVGTGHFCFRT